MSATNGDSNKVASLFRHAEAKLDGQTRHLDNQFAGIIAAINAVVIQFNTLNTNATHYQSDMKEIHIELRKDVEHIREVLSGASDKIYRVICLLALLLAGKNVIEFIDKIK